MSYFFGLCILTPLGRENKYATANLIGVPISFILNILLDNRFGAVGASIAILIAEGAIFIRQIEDSRDILTSIVSLKDTLRTLISHIVAFTVAFIILILLPYSGVNGYTAGGAFIVLVSGFAGYILTWLIIALLLHEDTAYWIFDTLSCVIRKLKR